MTMQGCW